MRRPMMNLQIKPIRTEKDYKATLRRINSLMEAEANTPEADELEVLATLVEVYEDKHFPMSLPNPVEAIKFRMEQTGLSARDLVPFIGSRSKVSEVLSGKRPLTLQMIRSLHKNLGISAEVLLHQSGATLPETPDDMDWSKFPLKEMANLGWIEKSSGLVEKAEEIMRDLINRAGGLNALSPALYRKNDNSRCNSKTNPYALQAWCYQLLIEADKVKLSEAYKPGVITPETARQLVNLSLFSTGPKLAQDFLGRHGIHVIYLPHLPRTHLDGAALLLPNGTPVIGLTIRYDRLDNFWFCLCHELAHIVLHLHPGSKNGFIDDLNLKRNEEDFQEIEADEWAKNVLIPTPEWEENKILEAPTSSNVTFLSHKLQIHPAIVAGRIRKELNNYRLLNHFVGNGEIRKIFNP
jgi:HTH-type transcriptional regulator / antitoxin HigA